MSERRSESDRRGSGHARRVRSAWGWSLMLWLASLVIAGGAFGTALFVSTAGEPLVMPERPIDASVIAAAIIFVLGTVGAPAIHWRMMHTYWREGVVQPRGYVIANALLYASYTATVVILSVMGMLAPKTWGFELMAAIPPMILLLLAWPTQEPMLLRRSRSEEDDPDILHMREEDEGE